MTLIQAGTCPHVLSESKSVSHSLDQFGHRVWVSVESSDNPLPPINPPLCPLHDFGVGSISQGFDRHEKQLTVICISSSLSTYYIIIQ